MPARSRPCKPYSGQPLARRADRLTHRSGASTNAGMGLLLKIILFGVAVYAVWRMLAHWKGLFDRFTGKHGPPARQPPARPPPAAPDPPAGVRQAKVIDASAACRVCGAYLSSAATKCGRTDCPLP